MTAALAEMCPAEKYGPSYEDFQYHWVIAKDRRSSLKILAYRSQDPYYLYIAHIHIYI